MVGQKEHIQVLFVVKKTLYTFKEEYIVGRIKNMPVYNKLVRDNILGIY